MRELYFLQDYLTTLHKNTESYNNEQLVELGVKIKDDFIEIAEELKSKTITFHNKGIFDMKINTEEIHHKYPKQETFSRLRNTNLGQIFNL